MNRAEFSKRTRLEAFERANGYCEQCGIKLKAGNHEYHHKSFDSSDNTFSNCVLLCRDCHSRITKERAPLIAKSNRIRERIAGIKRISGRPLPGTRRSKFKHKMNGTWERRS